MQGREHLVGISAQGKGLMLEILRYAHELRDPEPYFEKVTAEPKERCRRHGRRADRTTVRKVRAEEDAE